MKVRKFEYSLLPQFAKTSYILVSPEYFSSLGMSGQRQDQAKRPELNQGTMDFAVPKEYWASQPPPRLIPLYQATEDSLSAKKNSAADASATARQPEPLRVLFAIDVSSNAVSSGMLQIVCDGLREIIYGSETDDTSPRLLQFSRVGIITFDQAIHFYNLSVMPFRSVRMHFVSITIANLAGPSSS
jgi:protein transport protein SEC24